MILPPLNALKTFAIAARTESYARAAEELNVTHAAVSHQMKQLEEWFGRSLFRKSGRGVELTPRGTELQKTVQTSLLAIAATSARIRRDRERQTITVGCIPSIAARWLIPALPLFMAKHQSIEVRVQYAHATQRFDPDVQDVLISLSEDLSDETECVKLFSRINKPVTTVHYLAKHPLLIDHGPQIDTALLHDESQDGWIEWFGLAGRDGPAPMRGPIYQDFNMLASALLAGHGVALCPVEVFRREIRNGDLVILSEIATLCDEGYYMVSEKPRGRAAAAFMQWFCEQCRNDAISSISTA